MSRKTILTVEDAPNIRRLIAYILTKAGYKVLQAEDGQAAVEILQKVLPDLVLLDIRMPNMDGFQLLELIRKYDSEHPVPVVMLTSLNTPRDLDRAMALDVVDFLNKPIEPRVLLEKVVGIIGPPGPASEPPPSAE